MRIWINPEKLTALGLDSESVISAVKTQNVQASIGSIGTMPSPQSNVMVLSLTTRGLLNSVEEFENIINTNQGFIKAMWCGNAECEEKIQDLTSAKSRCMPFEQEKIDDKCVCCGKPADKLVIWGRQY